MKEQTCSNCGIYKGVKEKVNYTDEEKRFLNIFETECPYCGYGEESDEVEELQARRYKRYRT